MTYCKFCEWKTKRYLNTNNKQGSTLPNKPTLVNWTAQCALLILKSCQNADRGLHSFTHLFCVLRVV